MKSESECGRCVLQSLHSEKVISKGYLCIYTHMQFYLYIFFIIVVDIY